MPRFAFLSLSALLSIAASLQSVAFANAEGRAQTPVPVAGEVQAAQPLGLVLKLGPGRNVRAEISRPRDGQPTFLFLPGVNRGLRLEEPAAQELIRKGYGVATFDFSPQPLSIATLEEGERPDFLTNETTLASLVQETEAVARLLNERYAIKDVVPVSLSYSGAVSRGLSFARTIDSVPLTSTDAFSPDLALYRNWLRAAELLNPFWGPIITRSSLDIAYRTQWTQQVARISEQFHLPPGRREHMIEGYVRLSRATEDFEWKNAGDRAERTWVLAGKENPTLLRHQVETIRERLLAGRSESVFVVQEAGHVIPAEQPAVYARILELAVTRAAQPGITVVVPSSGRWISVPLAQTPAILDDMLSQLPQLPTGRSSVAPGAGALPGTL